MTHTAIYEEAAADGRESAKASRRRRAATYIRDDRHLLFWTFPPSRMAIILAAACPDSPQATRGLCHRLYRDLQTARTMPNYLKRLRPALIEELRTLFTCECQIYRRQRGVNEFINSIGGE